MTRRRPEPTASFPVEPGPGEEPPFDVACFTLMLRRAPAGGGDLLVVLSTRRAYALYRRTFQRDVLFVADKGIGFYVHEPLALAEAVMALADREGHRRVVFTGGSKAGFGALLIGGLCARLRPDRVIRVLAFQPRVFLWPYQPERKVPSYHRLHRQAANRRRRRRDLRRFGDATFVAELPNAVVRVVYSERNAEDRTQALSLSGPNVSHVAVPTAIHNTMGFLNLLRRPKEAVKAGVARMFGGDAADDGLSADAVERRELVRDILAAPDLPSFDAMLDEVFGLEPAPPPAGWARTVLVRRLRRGARRLADLVRPHPKIRSRKEVNRERRRSRAADRPDAKNPAAARVVRP